MADGNNDYTDQERVREVVRVVLAWMVHDAGLVDGGRMMIRTIGLLHVR